MKERSFRPRKDLTVILLFSVLLVALIEFVWRDMPPFLGWKHASRMGDIITTLALAYAATFIFHVLGELWNKREEHEDVQLRIEGNLLGLFNAFRILSKGMQEELGRQEEKPFNFILGDDTLISYDWDEMLSKKGFVAHSIAQRMYRHVYYQFVERFVELENDKAHLNGRILVHLKDVAAMVSRIKKALGSPNALNHDQPLEQWWYMNHVGDKINELHAELCFFKIHLTATWKCKHPLLRELLAMKDERRSAP